MSKGTKNFDLAVSDPLLDELLDTENKKVTSLHDRTELAWKFASKALQLRRYAP